jgi:hypothetical protein
MTLKRSLILASLCGLALVGAGCGDDDNQTLSYDDTGTEISEICETVSFDELNGNAEHDAPILDEVVPDFEQAVEDVRDLEVDEELEGARDEFADIADQQIAVLEEAQEIAETGNTKAYRRQLDSTQDLGRESDELASALGAPACADG